MTFYRSLFRLSLVIAVAVALTGAVVSAQGPVPIKSNYPYGMLVPDAELVFGPTLYGWDTAAFVDKHGGYMTVYSEMVDGEVLTGAQIVDRVAAEYSVGQRVLLTLIEMHGGWVTQLSPEELAFPVGEPVPGLENGLARAASNLSRNFYGHRMNGLKSFTLSDGSTVGLPAVNAGTFAVTAQVSRQATHQTWPGLQEPSRFNMAWNRLFGDPYFYLTGDLIPEELPRLDLLLPFEAGSLWFYTAGPYGPTGPGTPRSAIDFTPPPTELSGCHLSLEWVTAAAKGVVIRSSGSEVVVDTDGDGFEGSGWTHHYRHLADFQRAPVGTKVKAGDPIGHPSCDDGAQTVTRVGFSRRYNGLWIEADTQTAPLIVGGWAALPGLESREGWLIRTGMDPRQATTDKSPSVNGVTVVAGE